MSPDDQFWWNWFIQLAVAIGTLFAALMALFGDWLRDRLFPVKLRLQIKNDIGERCPMINTKTGEIVGVVRNYHVTVTNESRRSANQVQVYLLQLREIEGKKCQNSWRGEVPLKWSDQNINPITRTIGSPYDCDLCYIKKNSCISIEPIIMHTNLSEFLSKLTTRQTTIILTLQVRSNEGVSKTFDFKIEWDGEWEDEDTEMSQHIKFT